MKALFCASEPVQFYGGGQDLPLRQAQPHPGGRAQPAVQLRQRIGTLRGQPFREPGQLPVYIHVKGLIDSQQLSQSAVPLHHRGERAVNGKARKGQLIAFKRVPRLYRKAEGKPFHTVEQ